MKSKHTRTVAAAAVALALALPLLAQAQNLAVVNGKPVPMARYDALLNQVVTQGRQQRTPQLEQEVRDQVVLVEIYVQEAEKQGLQNGAEFRQQLEFARQQLLMRELFKAQDRKSPVTAAEVQAEYDKAKAQGGGKEFRSHHILVEKEADAKALIAQLKGGAKFEDLAKKNSKDTGSAQNGGLLEWSPAGAYVPEFGQALQALKKGQTTDAPVKTQFGFHVVRLDDVRDAQFPPLEQVKPQIEQRLLQNKLAAYRDELRSKAKTDYKFGAN